MNVIDYIFMIIENVFKWLSTIPIPGFPDVSLLDFQLAFLILGVIITGVVNVVPNSVGYMAEGVGERRAANKKAASKEKEAESKRKQTEDDIDRIISEKGYKD